MNTEPKYKTVKVTDNTNGKAIKISQGGFGKVYKVVKYIDNENGEIKCIIPFAQKQTRIFHEHELIGQNIKEVSLGFNNINNPHTQIYDHVIIHEKNNVTDSNYIINMSLADMTLHDIIYSNLSNNDRITLFFPLFKQIVEGLLYLHGNFICHCDIKPENILVYGNMNLLANSSIKESTTDTIVKYLYSSKLKITDYGGMNIEYNENMDKTSTLYYRSPELFLNYNHDKKSVKQIFGPFNDIWSLGIIMLEYLTKNNIISKLYKNTMKISEKEFLTRFYHCMRNIDITHMIKNCGYDLNNHLLRNIMNLIELSLTKKTEHRINIYNIAIYINHYVLKYEDLFDTKIEEINMSNTQKIYDDDIVSDNIDINIRKYALNTLEKFMDIVEYSDTNDKLYIPLGLNIYDRLMSKKLFKQYDYLCSKLLLLCYYIAHRYFLSDLSITMISEYLSEDIEILQIDVLEIIKSLNYDIYRPTILTYLNKQEEDVYHSKHIYTKAIEIYCFHDNINTLYNKSVDLLERYVYNEIKTNECKLLNAYSSKEKLYIKDDNTNIDNTDNINIDECTVPLLKRDDYDLKPKTL